MFPCFGEIVGGVPALERYLSLGRARAVHRPSGRRSSRDRSVVSRRVARRSPAALSRDPRRPAAGAPRRAAPPRGARGDAGARVPAAPARRRPGRRARLQLLGDQGRRPGRDPAQRAVVRRAVRPHRLPAARLPAGAARPVRVDVPGQLQALRVHAAAAGGGGGDERHRPPPARLLHAAAQLHLQRRVLLPVGGGRPAAGRAHRRHGGGRAAARLRRAGDALPAAARARDLPRLRARRGLRVLRGLRGRPGGRPHLRHLERRLRRGHVGLLHAGQRGAVLHQSAHRRPGARRGSPAARPSFADSRSRSSLRGGCTSAT